MYNINGLGSEVGFAGHMTAMLQTTCVTPVEWSTTLVTIAPAQKQLQLQTHNVGIAAAHSSACTIVFLDKACSCSNAAQTQQFQPHEIVFLRVHLDKTEQML